MYNVTIEVGPDKWTSYNILTITHNGEVVGTFTDMGEPEDNSFNRDYNWVSQALQAAYRFGLNDAEDKYMTDALKWRNLVEIQKARSGA